MDSYRPPPIAGPQPQERGPLRLRPIATGVAVDWLGTALASFFIFFLATLIGGARYRQEAQIEEYIRQLGSAPDFVMLSSLVGLLCVALGGYVCGVLAKQDPMRHAVIMGIVTLTLGLVMEANQEGSAGWYPLWLRVTGHVLVVPAAAFGGAAARARAEIPQ